MIGNNYNKIAQNLKLKTQNDNENLKTNLRYRGFHFSLRIIKFINKLPNNRSIWIITDQLLRCATSIGANIIEARSSSSRKNFVKFYDIALKSANETDYWLLLLKESKLIEEDEELKVLIKENEEISKMLASSLLTLKGKKLNSFKF
jgi:four helix bundle protein